jgi:hypothetical protein
LIAEEAEVVEEAVRWRAALAELVRVDVMSSS